MGKTGGDGPEIRNELPVLGHGGTERADAARNRRKILDAASRILDTAGPDGLLMEEVAAAAGVGVGTLYRRFGDRAGLTYALLDAEERTLQESILHGPPPLGPGAEPMPRLRSFLRELLWRVVRQRALLVSAESNSARARFTAGAYGVHHAHVAGLLREARPDLDSHYMADALLAPLTATLITHQLDACSMSVERIEAGLDTLVDSLEATAPAPRT
ncbi:TetR family transcriptional regulator [Haloactinospora alba]|uniref:TetR family transcriptional regulator n=1 Tax=Haloactinospora alba TaxID=405555 RepID=A0A543N8Z0_9ACTN|nr:TetR/AcrR family transcriptional regulator [Haloactinospora alba]TQN28293.1 TetR family transcriptional regulator [Haloactinospora alba]